MRILKRDLKHGSVRVRVDSADDLWALNGVIEVGDTVAGSTERKVKLSGSEERTKVAKRRVYLALQVEKTEYDGAVFKILGAITDGPDDIPRGEHHSFTLEQGSEIEIRKTWPSYQLRRLETATKGEAAILVVLFDREEAKLYGVTRRGVEEILSLKGKVAKKGNDEKTSDFYREIVTALSEREQQYRHIIAGAPAFWKEYLEKELPPELKKKTVFTAISAVEKTAIRELLRRPEVAKLLKESSTLRELELVEEMMEALGKEKLAYGGKEVEEAIQAGNCAKLLVTEKAVAKAREEERSQKLEALLQQAETMKAEVHIIADAEAMDRIDQLGGIAALRRW